MSFVGKILVVVQIVLSLLFMAFAGAVYAIHQNWKVQYESAQADLDKTRQSLSTSQEELVTAKRDFEAKQSEQQQVARFQAENTTLVAQLAAAQKQNNLLETEREAQTGLAEAKAGEARFRQEEAERQRISNEKLQAKLDETAAENRNLKDTLFSDSKKFEQLNRRYETTLEKTAYLERIVAINKLETDPEVVAKMQTPPPPVEGVILNVKKNRANRVSYAEISIGSDDGLVKGHELDVIRVVDTDKPTWLGRVKVVDVGPDWGVVEVVVPAKNGIIQEGDNVTSKLR